MVFLLEILLPKLLANNFTNIQGSLPSIYRPNPLRLNLLQFTAAITGSIAPKLVEIGGGVLGSILIIAKMV